MMLISNKSLISLFISLMLLYIRSCVTDFEESKENTYVFVHSKNVSIKRCVAHISNKTKRPMIGFMVTKRIN